MGITRQQTRRAARADATAVAKIIAVQEAQISELQAQIKVLEAVLIGVCGLEFDYVDMKTGEVTKKPLLST